MNQKAFIFDLDGVIVDTAKYHYLAWQKIANLLSDDFTLSASNPSSIIDQLSGTI